MSDFSCPICFETYQTKGLAVCLPCHSRHQFCSDCTKALIEASTRDNPSKCPNCRAVFTATDLTFVACNASGNPCVKLSDERHERVVSSFIGSLSGRAAAATVRRAGATVRRAADPAAATVRRAVDPAAATVRRAADPAAATVRRNVAPISTVTEAPRPNFFATEFTNPMFRR